jgi:hypothetical protein
VRLDHLLSKELSRTAAVAGAPLGGVGWVVGVEAHAPAERAGGGAHGWNVDYDPPSWWVGPSTPSFGGVGSGRPGRVGVGGTLLGPEGAGARRCARSPSGQVPPWSRPVWVGWGGVACADHRRHPAVVGCVMVGSPVA